MAEQKMTDEQLSQEPHKRNGGRAGGTLPPCFTFGQEMFSSMAGMFSSSLMMEPFLLIFVVPWYDPDIVIHHVYGTIDIEISTNAFRLYDRRG